ncbi:unnamed protein product [Rhizoctonia solani]|uniref:Uncharacterized protein n=1 Tax=Rhizoctonia solani TaxID=456999 RepID=A0A8H3DKR5_9AGAM|nr:unnamed protein product [Rhizoctonia solani]
MSTDTEVNGESAEQTQLDEVEVDEHDGITSVIGRDEQESVGSQGSETDEDSLEDTLDVSDTEEAGDFMSGEEDFVDDLYDL